MKKWKERGMAVLLAAMMTVNLYGVSVGAEEQASQNQAAELSLAEEGAQAAELQTTETPATEGQVTEAPATEARTTEAQITETQATEAPETQTTEPGTTEAPATEAQITETPATEEQQENRAPETTAQTETETETETESEEGVYEWISSNVSATVRLPESVILPENAVLKVELEEKDSDSRKDSIELVEKMAADMYFGEYIVYDIYFEADGSRLDLEDYTDGAKIGEEDIEVTVTFEKPIFEERNVKDKIVRVYHIKDLTEEELALAEETAREQAQIEGGTVIEIDKQKAVDLKTYVKLTENEDAVSVLRFYTDGFSDYVFAVTADRPETEGGQDVSESGNESESDETESGPEESGGTNETGETGGADNTSSTEKLISEEVPVMPLAEGTEEAKKKLTLYVGQMGYEANTDYVVALGCDTADFAGVTVTDSGGKELKTEISKDGSLRMTVPVTGKNLTKVTLEGLKNGIYKLDAGGTSWTGGKAAQGTQSQEYTSLYQKNGENQGKGAVYHNRPQTVTIDDTNGTDNQYINIYNVYTAVKLSLEDKESNNPVEKDAVVVLSAGNIKIDGNLSLEKGTITMKGLPVGNITVTEGTFPDGKVDGAIVYSWKIKNQESAPAGYVDKPDTPASFSFYSGKGVEVSKESKLEIAPTKVRLCAKNTAGDELSGLAMKIMDDTDGKLLEGDYKSGDVVTGRFVVGHKYTVTQVDRPAGYVKAKGKDSYKITIANTANTANEQGSKDEQYTVNKPITVKVGNADNSGAAVKGGTLQILTSDKKKVIATISGKDWKYTLSESERKLIEPGKEYYLVESKAPDGHYTAQKEVKFKLNEDGQATAVLKYVTTKLVFTRYYYDYIIEEKNGTYVYHTRDKNGNDIKRKTPLAGAVIQLVNSQGTAVDEWETTEKSYICEGKVNVGESYTLREISTPEGYATPTVYTFTTVPGAQQQGRTVSVNENGYILPYMNVSVQAVRYGSVEVAKRISYKGVAKKLSESRTFYCGLYTKEAMEKEDLYKEIAITVNANDVFGTAVFRNVSPGKYYLAETDGNGNRIEGQDGNEVFKATVLGSPMTVLGGTLAKGNIVNDFTKINTPLNDLSDAEKAAWNNVGSSYTGTTDEDGNAVTAANASTNDPTKFIPYIIMVILAFAAIVSVIIYKKKRKGE
ncbi:MAG: SpaA isopeptide-forming pilin-related protein [Eubacteriales bacterium]|nr:SpaA isopeptide-forming pilin-related protein [Eubacteriales bacterium]